jgi:hypothetical protein
MVTYRQKCRIIYLQRVNCLKYREERPRKKSVTRKRNRKETVTKNMRYLTMHQDKVNLSPISISKKNRNRGQPFQDLISMWPKIVEYIGLSEYESKVYLSLISLGTAGARKLSLNCDVPRTKVYGTLKKTHRLRSCQRNPWSSQAVLTGKPRGMFQYVT